MGAGLSGMMARMLRKMSQVVEVARTPEGRHALRHWRPFSLASYRIVSQLRRQCPEFRTVIDGGANVGQFARAAASLFPGAAVHSIEPLPDVAAELRRNLADVGRVVVHETCIGSHDGKVRFRRNAYSQSSSVLPMSAAQAEKMPGLKETEEIEVPMATLDRLLAGREIEPPALLKLDLQGYELEALKGAAGVLSKCSHVLAETVFEPMYEGEPVFTDLLLYLRGAGFGLVRPLAVLENRDGEIVQMDVLFRRQGFDAGCE